MNPIRPLFVALALIASTLSASADQITLMPVATGGQRAGFDFTQNQLVVGFNISGLDNSALEFALPIGLDALDISAATLLLTPSTRIQDANATTLQLTWQVAGYVGNGIAESADVTAGTAITLSMIGAPSDFPLNVAKQIDVTDFVKNLAAASQAFAGFSLQTLSADSGSTFEVFFGTQDFNGFPSQHAPQLVITYQVIPEPSVHALFLTGIILLLPIALAFRRRNPRVEIPISGA